MPWFVLFLLFLFVDNVDTAFAMEQPRGRSRTRQICQPLPLPTTKTTVLDAAIAIRDFKKIYLAPLPCWLQDMPYKHCDSLTNDILQLIALDITTGILGRLFEQTDYDNLCTNIGQNPQDISQSESLLRFDAALNSLLNLAKIPNLVHHVPPEYRVICAKLMTDIKAAQQYFSLPRKR